MFLVQMLGPEDDQTRFDGRLDFGKNLAVLHELLKECLQDLNPVGIILKVYGHTTFISPVLLRMILKIIIVPI